MQQGGDDRLGISEVDESLGKAIEHTAQLEQRAQMLQAHFAQAQKGMSEISRLCDEADMSVMRSQSLLNRSAHRIHELTDRMQHLLQDVPTQATPLQSGPSFGSIMSPLSAATPATTGGYAMKPASGIGMSASSRRPKADNLTPRSRRG
eukprot:TRINITY_DN5984_c1_g3_i1.p1 TRINITY_DN5984_c1_g3~~TRINITY_DN5984_c1_g3_i1.p1  ORF type:complete len:149 (+),score=33.77 TRINITY_DN5984_c1_g3_i1:63-509(+)